DTERQSSVPIIRYTSLPVEKEESADQDDAQPADPGKPNTNQGNNGNGNSNQNMNNNGNGNAGGGNDNSNNGKEKEKEKEKETKPDKGNAAERKITESKDKPDKGSSNSNVNSNEIGNSSNGTNQDSKPEKKK
ncbi:MAG TPA: hypothetical protein VFQ13_08950, partial [Anaerolineales bacterium]|nr:hypothetical protein [Anaerolineales bacterium]